MGLTLRLRRAVAYAATAIFFAVAALGQMQNADGLSAFLKAGVACLVLAAMGMMIVRIIEGAEQKLVLERARHTGRHGALPPRERDGQG